MKYSGISIIIVFSALACVFLFSACASTPAPEPVPEPEPTVQTPPPEPVQPEQPQDSGDFVVTEEIYQQTFDDVEAFINKLNAIIKNEDFEEWNTYLTDEYKAYYSDPAVLKSISEDLKKKYRYDIRLRTLKDYFIYIVVGSRQEATLDKIEFIDETHLLAYSIVNDTPAILYYLAYENGGWKIARWQ